jgi:tripeptidyl-peptidase-1
VEKWLSDHDLWESSSMRAGIIEIDTSIAQAEKLLNATYHWFTGSGIEDTALVRTESYDLPEDVAEIVEFVTPTTSFPLLADKNVHPPGAQQPLTKAKRDTCGSNDETTPTCVRQIYGIDYTAQPNRTTFAVYGTEAASFNPADLQTYLFKYNPPAAAASATFKVVSSDDANSSSSSSIEPKFETSLVTQVSLGLAFPAVGVLYNNGGVFGPNPGRTYDRFVSFLQELIVNETVPSVVSFSESLSEDKVDPAYARRVCNMMAQIGARGVSLLFSSGNNGANGDSGSGTHNAVFEPKFPASCPWVTAVGGTTNLANETAATQSTLSTFAKTFYTASGGGFSNLFVRPTYQRRAVSRYIKQHIPADYYSVSGFNASGRGIPDVSAFSTGFPTVVSLIPGVPLTVAIGGTSSATPLWAAVIALLNDYEASQGRPPLGFLNPWLYSLRAGIKDITTGGDNAGACNFLGGCRLEKTLGYNVTQGWDPVTGLGSPLWKGLVAALDKRGCSGH